eukprot:1151350-Pelagomonas_calceolata.AAC.7
MLGRLEACEQTCGNPVTHAHAQNNMPAHLCIEVAAQGVSTHAACHGHTHRGPSTSSTEACHIHERVGNTASWADLQVLARHSGEAHVAAAKRKEGSTEYALHAQCWKITEGHLEALEASWDVHLLVDSTCSA